MFLQDSGSLSVFQTSYRHHIDTVFPAVGEISGAGENHHEGWGVLYLYFLFVLCVWFSGVNAQMLFPISSVGRISFPQLAVFRFLSWLYFVSSVGRVLLPWLALLRFGELLFAFLTVRYYGNSGENM